MCGVEDFVGRDVFDGDGGRKAILREADLAGAQFSLNAFVLDGIEAVLSKKSMEGFSVIVATLSLRQEAVEEGAMFPGESAERAQSFDYASTVSPTGACAAGEGNDSD